MSDRETARYIIQYVGGKENIKEVTHCFTRLRFELCHTESVQKEKLEQLKEVLSVVESGGELQVVCGQKVKNIYDAMTPLLTKTETDIEEDSAKEPFYKRILPVITQIFTPLVPAIAASGLLKGLLTAAKLLMERRGVDITVSDTYTILFAVSQVIFYFFPFFLAYTTAKALHCNEIIAMVIGGTLVYPAIDVLVQNTTVATTIFGLPVIKATWQIGDSVKTFSYTESVIPIILAILVMSVLERFLKKWIPEVLQLILVPGLELVIMVPATLCVLGPVGIYISNAIQVVYDFIIGVSPILGGALVGGLWGVFVIFGAHRALVPIGLNDVALTGRQNILAFAGAANFAQGGAALGVLLKTKDNQLKQIGASGTVAAVLVGVTEPAIYGCNLPLKRPMICAIISGAIGGAVMGFGGVYGDAFANNGVLTIFTYAAFGIPRFIYYLVGVAIAYFGAAVLTYVAGFEDMKEEAEEITLCSPMVGTMLPLDQVGDPAFASGDLGEGFAILPTIGEVRAPKDGVIAAIADTKHAIGITLDSGIELLIHVGLNTVALGGQHFEAMVSNGDHVKEGQVLIHFDISQIKEKGYDLTTPVLIVEKGNHDVFLAELTEVHYDSQVFLLRSKKEHTRNE